MAEDLSKKRPVDDDNGNKLVKSPKKSCNETQVEGIHRNLSSFKNLQFVRVINEDSKTKFICIEGRYKNSEEPVVVLLEKTPFNENSCREVFREHTMLTQNFHNDIYGMYSSLSSCSSINEFKTTIIHPATPKHIEKYSFQPIYMITETPELYQQVTLPYITSQQFSLQWVYNILEHKKEAERIIFEDPDPETGFILIPDMKWDSKQMENLYILAVCHKRGIKSLRDLTAHHLDLLRNIKTKSLTAIQQKFSFPVEKLRIYVHYQPSYYHFHVHFTALTFDAPGIGAERAHLLDNIISSIEISENFYQKMTLSYVVRENEGLCQKFKESGIIK